MVRHIVAWKCKEEFSEQENTENVKQIKERLENLRSVIDGIVELKVYTDLLPSSTKNAVLNSLFESEEALKAYLIHPEHKRVSEFVRSVMTDRVCLDYQE